MKIEGDDIVAVDINMAALKSDIELYLKTYALTYTKSASEKFTEAAKKTIIDVYYGQYNPIYYNRTNDLMDNSYEKYFHDNGSRMYGGVTINDNKMSDYVNIWGKSQTTTSSADVINWTWRRGYHGYTDRNPSNAIFTFPPLSALEIEVGQLTSQLQNDAIAAAKSQSYQVLQF